MTYYTILQYLETFNFNLHTEIGADPDKFKGLGSRESTKPEYWGVTEWQYKAYLDYKARCEDYNTPPDVMSFKVFFRVWCEIHEWPHDTALDEMTERLGL